MPHPHRRPPAATSRRSVAAFSRRGACLALLGMAALALPNAARAADLHVTYRLTLAGLTIGSATLRGAFEGERYDLKLGGQLTGVAGLFSGGGRADVGASGRIAPNSLASAGFAGTGRSSSAERTVRIGVASGNVTSVSIEPPLEDREDRVPVTAAHRRGVTDPLSAMVAVAAPRTKPEDPANCDRTIPVFDGTMRFDVVLSFAETRVVQRPGFTGSVLVCNARYVPVAGHRPERPAVKFMEDNRDISVWLAPVEGTRVLVPLRVSVRTMMGTNVIEADRWTLTASNRAASQ